MRRRADPVEGLGEVPTWLRRFSLAEWSDPDDRPLEGWEFPAWVWVDIRARERWRDAGRAWLAERGYAGRWYDVVYPSGRAAR